MEVEAGLCGFFHSLNFSKMTQAFDSYIEDGKIYIVTTDFDRHGNRVVTHNQITIERAQEIAKELRDNINLLLSA
jgi:hypothetical protein